MFRSLLSDLGYSHLVIQHGSIPTDFATRLSVPSHGLQIKTFDFLPDIRSEIKKHDLVISHAGTGSILDALRLNKPLIAVVNPDLLHNHQLDIAIELERQGCLVCCSLPTVELVCAGLERVGVTRFVPLPQPSVVLQEIVEHEGGVTTTRANDE